MSGMIPNCSHLGAITVTELPASVDGCEEWSWCFVDEVAMIIPEVTGGTRIPPSPMLS